jgi:hypothetical protein
MHGIAVSVAHSHALGAAAKRLATPQFGLAGGSYVGTRSVTLSVPDGSQIRYTTDGSTPTGSSTLYTAALSVTTGTTTIKAIGIKAGANNSQVASATYVIS